MNGANFKTSAIRSITYVSVSVVTMLVGMLGVQGILYLLYNEDVPSRTLGIVNIPAVAESPSICGNNILERLEECDGIGGSINDCVSLGYYDGNVSCNTNCTLNMSECITLNKYCGNGIINLGEECDSTHFGAQTCNSFGYDTGDLMCNNNCTVNKNNCSIIVKPTILLTN